MTATMRSFFLPAGYGKPSTYKLGELPKPAVSTPDNVLIKVHAASLNPIDMRYAEGTMKPMLPAQEFPSKIGYDASGVIEQVGDEAKNQGWNVGDEVFVRLPHEHRGSLSEYALTTSSYVARKPKNISHVEAASLPLVSMTAYQALGRIEGGREGLKDKNVLVTAGMGGAGSIGIQIAKAFGARVTTTMSGSKMARAKELLPGVVDQYIDYKNEDPAQVIKPRSLDFIFDTAGGNVSSLFPLLKEKHKMISIAAMPNGDGMRSHFPDTPWYVSSGLDLYAWWRTTGPAEKRGVEYDYHWLKPNGEDLAAVGKLVEEGKVKPVVGEVHKFDQAGCRQAAEVVMGRGSSNGGKVVIKIVE
ncbi:hypothetical protein AOL_s00215g894 [Orbilia oligospora ATCC 24927]|uniref:Enoyl reductase (ER) domain-containing protein n=2 Tax=Orbilia oligospora TaxID=2813651 RepID=G1XV86_ARTOA|nr:hypothetical protein AOL_s00215g894 [Orbilia oligospora ATCC 24927]EGX42945.1 hypothetical protein AOL_s00215g894 [Orbilia oligospora ATCC 24927]